MKKIKNKILLIILGSIVLTAGILSVVSVNTTLSSSKETTQNNMIEMASIVSQNASSAISSYKTAVSEIAQNPFLSADESTDALRKDFIDEKVSQYYMQNGSMLDAKGVDIFSDENFSNSDFFNASKNGETYFSEPIINDSGTDAYIIVSAPITKNGEFDGVLYFQCDTVVLQDLVNNVSIGETGTAYILDSEGTTIAYNDFDLVLTQANAIAESASNPSDKATADLAAIERDMINGKTGFASYEFNGVDEYQAYTPINGTNGWSIAVTSTESELLEDTMQSIYLILGICAVMIVLGVILALKVSSSISKPITDCVDRLDLLVQGDLKSSVPVINTKDETSQLASSTQSIIANLSEIIFDLQHALSNISKGNLDFKFDKQEIYIGDYASMYSSVIEITESLSSTLEHISTATEKVSKGGVQMAAGSHELAQGATEQNEAIEQLAMSIDDISKKTVQTADDSKIAKIANQKSQEALSQGQDQMQEMLSAMKQINNKATEISNIVKAIDDIAFQTNILALNAAVEAARAGSAGKGFAVVADEVRNLAAKSAQSAKDTTVLIEETLAVVNNGNRIANQTSESISLVYSNAHELSGLVDRIATAVGEQAESVEGISSGINQISTVVQTNAATAEESAAISEELSGQVQTLKHLVGKFTLKK